MMYCDHTLVATDDFWHNVEQHPEKLKWYTKNCVTRLNVKHFTAGNGQRKKKTTKLEISFGKILQIQNY